MKKFLALYMVPASVSEAWGKMSPEDQKKAMQVWVKWGEDHKADLVELGSPLGANKRITKGNVSDVRS